MELSSIQSALDTISTTLISAASSISDATKSTVHNDTLRVLQGENTKLMEMVAGQTRQLVQMKQLVKDLASPCIGCKKMAWAPHAADCAWVSTSHLLEGLVDTEVDVMDAHNGS